MVSLRRDPKQPAPDRVANHSHLSSQLLHQEVNLSHLDLQALQRAVNPNHPILQALDRAANHFHPNQVLLEILKRERKRGFRHLAGCSTEPNQLSLRNSRCRKMISKVPKSSGMARHLHRRPLCHNGLLSNNNSGHNSLAWRTLQVRYRLSQRLECVLWAHNLRLLRTCRPDHCKDIRALLGCLSNINNCRNKASSHNNNSRLLVLKVMALALKVQVCFSISPQLRLQWKQLPLNQTLSHI